MRLGIGIALILAFAPLAAFAHSCPTVAQVKSNVTGKLPNGQYVWPRPNQVLTRDPAEEVIFEQVIVTFYDARRPVNGAFVKIECRYAARTPYPADTRWRLIRAEGSINTVRAMRDSFNKLRRKSSRNFFFPQGRSVVYFCYEGARECRF